ncbi:GNAT family N-acetyltransferase [Undibacterium macrobrachii]|jgi:ribosomal protein S18 acetylase RimI-like enzyme|uniref:N-acetyltransferase YuaI n=1 Tax=Undibacterium macrobrachii TaxID=1119058 RepID=A0ABQ2X841_9BURK|nr:GNAT family N-acetyltransferase [Undibacterium macrobrachii]GGX03955.1 putative N-acetyltransferase YuaI [Undibacterium macrobrachii]
MNKIKEIQLRRATVADAEAIAAIRIEGWRTTYRGMIPDSYLNEMDMNENVLHWRTILQALPVKEDSLCVYVAVSDNEIVGFVSAMKLPEPKLGKDGEINAIYIRPQWQRCGIGKRMLHKAARSLQAMGCTSCVIWVIDGNAQARNFYEELGGEILIEQDFSWDGLDLTEVGYGWNDLSVMMASADAMPFPRAMQ